MGGKQEQRATDKRQPAEAVALLELMMATARKMRSSGRLGITVVVSDGAIREIREHTDMVGRTG